MGGHQYEGSDDEEGEGQGSVGVHFRRGRPQPWVGRFAKVLTKLNK